MSRSARMVLSSVVLVAVAFLPFAVAVLKAARSRDKLFFTNPGSESGKRARTMLAQLKQGNS